MKQIALERPGHFVASDARAPVAGPGEALVRVHRLGLCGTDFHAFHGRQAFFTYPRVLGHELGVEVVEVPPNQYGISAGDHCAIEPYLNCGTCRPCRLGHANNCENINVLGVHIDGGMRELFAVPIDHLYKSSKLSFEQLALVEPLSIGAQAVMRSGLSGNDEVLVVGAGPIGLGVAQLALAAGASVRVLETAPARRELVARLGVETLAQPDEQWADVVIDATGNANSMAQSVHQVKFGGRVVWVGIVQGAVPLDDPVFHHREATLLASRNSSGHFPRLIRMLEQGRIDSSVWITQRLGLDEVIGRFDELSKQKEGIKTMVEVS
jgi:2-desacetyl-2-hydroxyethyl bacteriochlorophyllide A dehydrogenase